MRGERPRQRQGRDVMQPTVTRIRRVEGGYLDHLTDTGFFVQQAPRGRDRFQVMERGAGPPIALDDARRAWWVLDDADDTVAGGPPIYSRDRADELAKQFNGRVVSGEEFIQININRTKETP